MSKTLEEYEAMTADEIAADMASKVERPQPPERVEWREEDLRTSGPIRPGMASGLNTIQIY